MKQVTSNQFISAAKILKRGTLSRHKQVKQLFQTCVTDVEEALHEMKDLQQQGQHMRKTI
ncbi:hypothetical protein CW304_13450 [Bacillus sp. UFRGS-B20]|nr:hypothetical protein CW304_13450 [Bacillus sp. UFRGS-B20]